MNCRRLEIRNKKDSSNKVGKASNGNDICNVYIAKSVTVVVDKSNVSSFVGDS